MQDSNVFSHFLKQLIVARRWTACVFALGFFFGGFPLHAADCVAPPPGLISWWPGEGSASDTFGTNSGTLSGGVTFDPGYVGQAFDFDGTSGQVFVPDSPSLRLTNQITIEAWINPRSTNLDRVIVSKLGISNGNNGYALFLAYPNLLRAEFNTPTLAWPGYVVSYNNPSAITTQTWYHVAFTYDQSAMKLYLNGIPVATNIIGPQTIATSPSRLCLSGVDENNPVRFDGSIDEPSLYGRALSDAEILAIYNAGHAGKCGGPVILSQPASKVGYWGMNATFNVQAAGAPPLTYAWLKNGVPILNATNATLSLTNLQASDATGYSVIVSNAFGGVLSQTANLTVNPAGVSIALYTGITIQGVVGLTYGIQYNTDLSNTNTWRGTANVTLGAPTQPWFDVQPAIQPQRYYRVVPGPISIP